MPVLATHEGTVVKKRLSLAPAAGALVAAMLPGAVAAQDDEAEDISLLFVVSTTSGSVEGEHAHAKRGAQRHLVHRPTRAARGPITGLRS
jgi:hypothetical protein